MSYDIISCAAALCQIQVCVMSYDSYDVMSRDVALDHAYHYVCWSYIVAIFYPFSQFCEIGASLLSLQSSQKQPPRHFRGGVEYGKGVLPSLTPLGAPHRASQSARRRPSLASSLGVLSSITCSIIITVYYYCYQYYYYS